MAHAEKCPVCHGTGKITKGGWHAGTPLKKTCHGCGGKGWVTVQDNDKHKYSFPMFPKKPKW